MFKKLEKCIWMFKVFVIFFCFFWWTGAVPSSLEYYFKPEGKTLPVYHQLDEKIQLEVRSKLNKIVEEAHQQGKDYGLKDYHDDMHRIAGIELEYMAHLAYGVGTEGGFVENELFNIANQNRPFWTKEDFNDRQDYLSVLRLWDVNKIKMFQYVKYQDNLMQWKDGVNPKQVISYLEGDGSRFENAKDLFWFILIIYFKTALGAFVFYLLRFWDPELDCSLREELLFCPHRLILNTILWPKKIWSYPKDTFVAKELRYARITAQYLRFKKGLSRLTGAEKDFLRNHSERPVAEFGNVLEKLTASGHLTSKRSLAISYLVLMIGIMLWPTISLAKDQKLDSEQKKASCYLYQLEDNHQNRDGPTKSVHDDDTSSFNAICSSFLWQPILLVMSLIYNNSLDTARGSPRRIDHIPLLSGCVLQVCTTTTT